MPTDRDLIQMHLTQYVYECRDEDHADLDWFDLLFYCSGYYGKVTDDMIMVVRGLQRDGLIK